MVCSNIASNIPQVTTPVTNRLRCSLLQGTVASVQLPLDNQSASDQSLEPILEQVGARRLHHAHQKRLFSPVLLFSLNSGSGVQKSASSGYRDSV